MSYASPYIGRTGIIDAVLRSKIPLITSGQLTDPIIMPPLSPEARTKSKSSKPRTNPRS